MKKIFIASDHAGYNLKNSIILKFSKKQKIIDLGTNLTKKIWQEIIGVKLPAVFPQLTYKDSMEKYGTDKPDLRFEMPLLEFEEYIKNSSNNENQLPLDKQKKEDLINLQAKILLDKLRA